MEATRRLKERIERVLLLAGFDGAKASSAADDIIGLFRDCGVTPEGQREDARGRLEEQLAGALHSPAASPSAGSIVDTP